MKPFVLLLLCLGNLNRLPAQHIELLNNNKKISIRGMSVVTDKIIWVSGNNGAVGKSVDAGKTWQWMTVKNFTQRDFRDIEAFDENTAIIMAVAEPANILKTTDGGKSWKTVFTDSTKGMFLDAMEFKNDKGVVIGDPINNQVFMAYTNDSGNTWVRSPLMKDLKAEEGEAFFASSGTNIVTYGPGIPVFVSGGKQSAIFESSRRKLVLPIIQGENSTGANSIAMSPDNQIHGIIVGGDFLKDTARKNNCVLFTMIGQLRFSAPQTPPYGYRSCVEYINRKKLICCGTSGVDISDDGGLNWKNISKEGFHVCRKAKNGEAVFLAGANGKIGILTD